MNPTTTAQTGLVLPLRTVTRPGRVFIEDAEGSTVAVVDTGGANDTAQAAELVRLANAHCELVSALQTCVEALTDGRIGTIDMDRPQFYETLDRAAQIGKTALANATRQTQV